MPKPRTCQQCGAAALKRRSTTYPLVLPGRQINVARVQVDECGECGHLVPTAAGRDKLQRCLQSLAGMLDTVPK
jgi:YgiT-type zinc finger domain-containing protein